MKVIKEEPGGRNWPWYRNIERRLLVNLLKAQDFLKTCRATLCSAEFWNFSWLWKSFLMTLCSLRIKLCFGEGEKRKLMSWVSSHVPKKYVEKDFPDCFKDGILLCALAEKVTNGACPRYDLLDPDQPLRNLMLALHLVEKYIKIKTNITVDEILQEDKFSEKKLGLLVAQMKLASEKFNIKGNFSKFDKDYVSKTTFVSEKCFARGMGLFLAVCGRKARFTIILDSTDYLDMVIEIDGPKNTACNKRITNIFSLSRRDSADRTYDPQTMEIIPSKKIPLTYTILGRKISVSYTPLESGKHLMSIIWQGQHIMGSPFTIMVDSSVDAPDILYSQQKPVYNRLQRTDSKSCDEYVENNGSIGLESFSESAGTIMKKRILRYIVKIDGTDVVIDGKEDLCEAINSIKNNQQNPSSIEEVNNEYRNEVNSDSFSIFELGGANKDTNENFSMSTVECGDPSDPNVANESAISGDSISLEMVTNTENSIKDVIVVSPVECDYLSEQNIIMKLPVSENPTDMKTDSNTSNNTIGTVKLFLVECDDVSEQNVANDMIGFKNELDLEMDSNMNDSTNDVSTSLTDFEDSCEQNDTNEFSGFQDRIDLETDTNIDNSSNDIVTASTAHRDDSSERNVKNELLNYVDETDLIIDITLESKEPQILDSTNTNISESDSVFPKSKNINANENKIQAQNNEITDEDKNLNADSSLCYDSSTLHISEEAISEQNGIDTLDLKKCQDGTFEKNNTAVKPLVENKPILKVSFLDEKRDSDSSLEYCRVLNDNLNLNNKYLSSQSDDLNFFPVHKVAYESLHDDDDSEDNSYCDHRRRRSFTELHESNYLDDDETSSLEISCKESYRTEKKHATKLKGNGLVRNNAIDDLTSEAVYINDDGHLKNQGILKDSDLTDNELQENFVSLAISEENCERETESAHKSGVELKDYTESDSEIRNSFRMSHSLFQCDHTISLFTERIDGTPPDYGSTESDEHESASDNDVSNIWGCVVKELDDELFVFGEEKSIKWKNCTATGNEGTDIDPTLAAIYELKKDFEVRSDNGFESTSSNDPFSSLYCDLSKLKGSQSGEIDLNKNYSSHDSADKRRRSWCDRDFTLSCIRESSVEGLLDSDAYNDKIRNEEISKNNSYYNQMKLENMPDIPNYAVSSTTKQNVSYDGGPETASTSSTSNKPESCLKSETKMEEMNDAGINIQTNNTEGRKSSDTQNDVSLEEANKNVFSTVTMFTPSPYNNKNQTRKHSEVKFSVATNFEKTPNVNSPVSQPSSVCSSRDKSDVFILTYAKPAIVEECEDSLEDEAEKSKEDISNEVLLETEPIESTEIKSAQCLSVKKVIQIFQQEKEEPLDTWPTEIDNKIPTFRKKINDIDIADHHNTKNNSPESENCESSPVVEIARPSIKDRVKLFEGEEPKSPSLKKYNKLGKRVHSSISAKKDYWENIAS